MLPLPADSLRVGGYYRNKNLSDNVGHLLPDQHAMRPAGARSRCSLDLPRTSTSTLNATVRLTNSEQLSGADIGVALNEPPKQQASASLNWKPGQRLRGHVRGIFRGEEAITEA